MKQIDIIEGQCNQLRLPAIAKSVITISDQATSENISYLEYTVRLLGEAITVKEQRNLAKKLKEAQLPLRHNLDGFDCTLVEGIAPVLLANLKELTWIDQALNLIIMGPPGVGKTMLSGGLCHHAIINGYSAFFRTMDQLMTTLSRKDTNRSAAIEHRRLLKANLIVIDDVMMIEPDAKRSNAFFHFINSIYENSSIVITTNKSPKQWVDKLGDEVLTAAILDRVLHHAEIIKLAGESQRKIQGKGGQSFF